MISSSTVHGGAAFRPVAAMAIASLMLLVACCVNVGGLFSVRGATRRSDIATAQALGASERALYWEAAMEAFILLATAAMAMAQNRNPFADQPAAIARGRETYLGACSACHGVNMITGDYSRGAAGMWIENGELAYPVEEITVAGNLKEMLLNIEMAGNDLEMRGRIAAPTVKLAKMTVAGE